MSGEWWAILGTLVAWLGLAVILLALAGPWIAQRFKGRRRCPKCWYDLSQSPPPAMTCSECGYTANRERKLYKARRRWKLAFLGVFMLIGAYAMNVMPGVKDRGWVAAVPTSSFILALPWLSASPSGDVRLPGAANPSPTVVGAISWDVQEHRLRAGAMPDWQFRWLIRRASSTTTSSRRLGINTGPEWELDLAGSMLTVALYRYDAAVYDRYGPTLESMLDELALDTVLMRDRWPAAVPLRIQVNPPNFFRSGDRRVTIVADLPDAERVTTLRPHSIAGFAIPWRESAVEVGVPLPKLSEVVFHLTVHSHASARTVSFRKPLTLVDEPHDAIKPAQRIEIAEAIRSGMRVQLPALSDSPARVMLTIDPSLLERSDLALGLVFEVKHGDEVVLSGDAWHGKTEQGRLTNAAIPLAGDVQRVLNRCDEDESWTVTVRGDPVVAMRDFAAERYWSGEVVVPLRSVWRKMEENPFPGLADNLTPPSRSHPDTRPELR